MRVKGNGDVSFGSFEGNKVGFLRINLHVWLRKSFSFWRGCGCRGVHGLSIGRSDLRIFVN